MAPVEADQNEEKRTKAIIYCNELGLVIRLIK